ncbi:Ran-binding protein, putative [Plasmodium gallinaceum]|uniref:Ran-binding protein, putative n=1 Tax=Plasmodium gallinaceum TaxID=5849 RepID=A0A1J1GN78_PLAGA|nr:Ran-binding protein, putative [Plasmodium gallinaceum]CRG93890.1 Ran-binding protein, putative [Plasmodium gallinaceum]
MSFKNKYYRDNYGEIYNKNSNEKNYNLTHNRDNCEKQRKDKEKDKEKEKEKDFYERNNSIRKQNFNKKEEMESTKLKSSNNLSKKDYKKDDKNYLGKYKDRNFKNENRDNKSDNRFEKKYDSKYDKYDDKYDRKYDDKYYKKHDDKYDKKYDDKYDRKYDNKYDRKYDDKYDRKHDDKYDRKYDDKFDRNYDSKYDRKHDIKYDDEYNVKRSKRRHEERKNSNKSVEKNYHSRNNSEYYHKYRNRNFEKERRISRSNNNNTSLYNKNENRRNESKSISKNKEERKISYNNDDDEEREYSSNSYDKYNKYNKKKKRFIDYEENGLFANDNIKKIKNTNEILENKTNIELSRFIFIYKIPDDITEEEIDEIIRNIAINNAFSLPLNIYINKLSYFSIKDDLFIKENLEFLKNNSYFNNIQQYILNEKSDNKINDDKCCIIEFPSNEACGKLFSLFEENNCIEIKKNICYIFPIFKLKKKNKNNEEKQQLKKFNDWYCSLCNFLNFSRRTVCYFCKAAKTSDSKIVETESKNISNFLKNNVNKSDNLYLKNNFNLNNDQKVFNNYAIDSFNAHPGYTSNINNLNTNYEDMINDKMNFIKNTNILNANNDISLNDNYNSDYNLYSYNLFHIFENNIENFETTKEALLNEEKTNMLILKDIDGSISNKDIIKFLNKIFEKRNVDYLYLFNDIKGSNKRKGFCFIEFNNQNVAEKMMKELEGNYYINFQSNYLKLDYVNSKEKQCFFNCINLAKLNINKSSAIVTKNYIPYFNFFVNYFEAIANMNLIHYAFFLVWSSQIIILKNGKPELTEFFFDYNSQYYYHPIYQIYFDNNTKFYMSLSKGYYIWNAKAECLVRIYLDNEEGNYYKNENTNESLLLSNSLKNNIDENVCNKNNDNSSENNKTKNTNENVTNTKISTFVEKVRKIALASKKTIEQMNINESNCNNLEKKNKEIIKKHFSTDSAEENDFSDKELEKKNNNNNMDNKNNENNQGNKEYNDIPKNNSNSSIHKKDTFNEYITNSNLKFPNNKALSNSTQFNNNKNFNEFNNLNNSAEKNDINQQCSSDNLDIICFVCLRKFLNKELLQKHIDMSSLHKKNLQNVLGFVAIT